jgi:hypothetical protein
MHINRIPPTPLNPTRNPTRVHHIEDDHHNQHEQRIKRIDIVLMLQQRAIIALQVLHHPEHRAHHDQEARGVHGPDVLLPREGAARLDRWDEDEAPVEADGDDHEEGEEGELHEQPDDDDVAAEIEGCLRSGGLVASAWDWVLVQI